MSISRGDLPALPEATPRCTGAPGGCRPGDWIYPADVFEWWGRKGIQSFQPCAEDPFDPSAFDPALPVWAFERTDHPLVKPGRKTCQVWKRVT